MSSRLLVLLLVPAYVALYASIAASVKRRFGLLGLVVVAYILWAVAGRALSLAHTAAPGERKGAGNLALLADLVGAVALVVICIQVQRRPDGASVAGTATRALVIGTVLVTTLVLAALILLANMAP
jgi:hypothetical protein